MQIKLSILIPSVHTRRNTFLPKIQDSLFEQYDNLDAFQQSQIEIIVLCDNKRIMLGDKRNIMVEMAQGEYIQFIDDDDRIEPDFLKELLIATKHNTDVITFNVSVSLNGNNPKIAYYSKEFKKDYNTNEAYYRIPNHICCVKREVSLKSSFPSLKYAEDQAYAKVLLPHIKSEHQINKVLYHYDYNDNVTETQFQNMPDHIRKRREDSPIVDIVFLSKASNSDLEQMTQTAIDTCLSGANQLPVNIIVIEQIPNVRYNNATTVYHNASFNYNSFANVGARQGSAPWIMIANSDLIFHHGWLHELLSAGNDVVSPHERNDPRQQDIIENTWGTINGKHFSGWCFMIKRSLWEEIQGFDDCVNFWFSDDVTIEQVLSKGVTPMIVKKSLVDHLGSTTLKTLSQEDQGEYCWGQVHIFNSKYGKNKFEDNRYYQEWKHRTAKLALQ
ncbi:MAG: glycosyltransferase [Sphingobacterium sp.]|jgi:glycosyltransferase involved in cell wall biosynthesis|nr:glycosyltransferase [Sphingobacterium sp.]